jgi:hypothetical protein
VQKSTNSVGHGFVLSALRVVRSLRFYSSELVGDPSRGLIVAGRARHEGQRRSNKKDPLARRGASQAAGPQQEHHEVNAQNGAHSLTVQEKNASGKADRRAQTEAGWQFGAECRQPNGQPTTKQQYVTRVRCNTQRQLEWTLQPTSYHKRLNFFESKVALETSDSWNFGFQIGRTYPKTFMQSGSPPQGQLARDLARVAKSVYERPPPVKLKQRSFQSSAP